MAWYKRTSITRTQITRIPRQLDLFFVFLQSSSYRGSTVCLLWLCNFVFMHLLASTRSHGLCQHAILCESALCTIIKNRFCHLGPPAWLRQTLHYIQRLCMGNMRFRHENCSENSHERFWNVFLSFILIYKRHYCYGQQNLVQVTQING